MTRAEVRREETSAADERRPSADVVRRPLVPRIRFGSFFEMHPVVFPAGALCVAALVGLTFVAPRGAVQETFLGVRDWIGNQFGWLYVASMNGFLAFSIWLALGRFGDVRLGRDGERPEFGRFTWFAMLFSAGMGIGLIFWSVAEPTYHFLEAPPGLGNSETPSRAAIAVTIFHWALHPWALYAVVALALAYFSFRHGMPLSFRSLLHPILGDRVWGRVGDVVDTLTIIATLIGVATSLGIGAQQINAGLAFLFGWPIALNLQVALIVGITAIATVSVVLGLGTGIRRLSELNIVLAAGLLLMVIGGFGVTAYLAALVDNVGAYLQVLPSNAFRTGAFSGEGRAWLNSWTVFYWAWWISWSPFVGMFIARVSRGRTIREFLIGVLLVPTAIGIAWLTAFGTSTLRQHTRHLERVADEEAYDAAEHLPIYSVGMVGADGELLRTDEGTFRHEERPLTAVEYLSAPIVNSDGTATIDSLPTVLFALLEGVVPPGGLVLVAAGIATICILLFFVTSSDSASMVIDMIASGGNPDPPVGTRLFWAITEGVVAAALLVAGGLEALQSAAIAAALPMTVILLMTCYALTRALDHHESDREADGNVSAS